MIRASSVLRTAFITLMLIIFFIGACDAGSKIAQKSRPLPKTFYEWCLQSHELSPQVKPTIEALLAQARTSDCQQADHYLSSENLGIGFDGESITDLTPISSLTKLESLVLHSTFVEDLTPITSLTNLTSLQISGAKKLKSIEPLSALKKLTGLDIWMSPISDLKPIASLTEIKRIIFMSNQITDLTFLSSLTKLTNLTINDNQVKDITPLSSLVNLKTLNLSCNQIVDVSPLASLKKLGQLSISDNQIKDISLLIPLESLFYLSAKNNQIRDPSPIHKLHLVDSAELEGNPTHGTIPRKGKRDCGYVA